MTDLQTITAIFARAKLGLTIDTTREVGGASANGDELPRGMTLTMARAGEDTPRHFGYLDFYAELYFDHEGALMGIGAWE